jgi:hypothetical protein
MEIFTFLLIHLITPALGLIGYIFLIKKILKGSIENPPLIDLFFIFSMYGGILMIILTSIFWKWSAMASLGAFFLAIPGLIIMCFIALRNYKIRHVSIYHRLSFGSGLAYCIMITLTFLVANLMVGK